MIERKEPLWNKIGEQDVAWAVKCDLDQAWEAIRELQVALKAALEENRKAREWWDDTTGEWKS